MAEPVNSASTVLEAALGYAGRGWRVIPIIPGKKHPGLDSWQTQATTDPGLIKDWWRRWPDHGVGIVTGQASGIFVLDVDNGPGKTGDDSLADLEATYGPLPDTIEAITGSGGRHIYFRHPTGLIITNNQSGRLGLHLDIRGEGGQVLAAPTLHPATGHPYVWEVEHHPDHTDLADAPDWLLDLLTDNHGGDKPTRERAPRTNGQLPGDRFAAEITWPELLESVGATYLGRRRHHASDTTYELWSRPPAPGEDDFTPHTSATLYYHGSDVLKVFTSNWRWVTPDGEHGALDADETYTRFGFYAARWHHGDHQAAAAALKARHDAADIAELLGRPDTTPAPLNAPDSAADDTVDDDELEAAAVPLGPWLIHWPDFLAQDHNAEDWLVDPFLAKGRSHVLYAGAKTGKSLLALYVAAALATGRQALNRPPGDPRHVLYVDYEMTPADLAERIEEFGYSVDDAAALAFLHYAQLPSIPPLDTKEGGLVLARSALAVGAELVILDTTGRAIHGEENDADSIRDYYNHTGILLKQAGITTLRLDHAGKDPTKGQRGTSAKNDDVDIVWQMIRRDGGGFTLKATHRRVSWVPEIVELNLLEDTAELRYETVRDNWPEGTQELAAKLDELGVPLEAGRPAATKALRAAGVKARNERLSKALAYRREAVENLAGAVPDSRGQRDSADCPPDAGTDRVSPVPEGWGQRGTGVRSVGGPMCVPLEGHMGHADPDPDNWSLLDGFDDDEEDNLDAP